MSFKQTEWVWQPLASLFLAVCLLLAAPAAHAGVQEVRVLATGVDRSSSKAAALAVEFAKRRAVYLVARKMTVENVNDKLADLTPGQWAAVVRGATVLKLKRVGETTYADVSVTVVNEALRRALSLAEPVLQETQPQDSTRGVLVLPLLVGSNRAYLWEDDNLLREPLRGEALQQARGAVIMAAGDFDDRRLVDYQNALDVTVQQLQGMYTRYGVDEIIVAVVTLGDVDTMNPTKILLRRLPLPPFESRVESIELKPGKPNDTHAMRVEQATHAIAGAVTRIAGSTSQRQLVALQKAPQLPIAFRYATAQDLASMQQAVRQAPGVLQLVMPAIALQDMRGTLYLRGTKEQVRQYLLKQGYIVLDEGDGWLISVH